MKQIIRIFTLAGIITCNQIYSRQANQVNQASQINLANQIPETFPTRPALLIIASRGFEPFEYQEARAALENAGIPVVIASNCVGTAYATPNRRGGVPTVQIDLQLDQVNVTDYDGIFFIGGPLVLQYLDNEKSYRIAQDAVRHDIPIGAISYAPRILAQAGILNDKFATGWNGDDYLPEFFEQLGVKLISSCTAPVVVHGKIITSVGRTTATEFGHAIAEMVLFNAASRLKPRIDKLAQLIERLNSQYRDLLINASQFQIPKARITSDVYLYWPEILQNGSIYEQQTQLNQAASLSQPYIPQQYMRRQ